MTTQVRNESRRGTRTNAQVATRSIAVLVVGGQVSHDVSDPRHDEFARAFGAQLGRRGHHLLVCSEHEKSFDLQTLRGFGEAHGQSPRLTVYHPQDRRDATQLREEAPLGQRWLKTLSELQLPSDDVVAYAGPDLIDRGWSYAVLLCQLMALDVADAIVALGGSTNGAAMMLLSIARQRRKPIVPLGFLGGAAERLLEQLDEQLVIRLSRSHPDVLSTLRSWDRPTSVVDIVEAAVGVGVPQEQRIFISYSWSRAGVADQVEANFRRLAVDLFRDSRGIELGGQITPTICDEIDRCSLFLALWCKEYVASPHCFDEMERAMARRQKRQMRVVLLRLDDTRAVWPFVRGGGLDDFDGNWPKVYDATGAVARRSIDAAITDLITESDT